MMMVMMLMVNFIEQLAFILFAAGIHRYDIRGNTDIIHNAGHQNGYNEYRKEDERLYGDYLYAVGDKVHARRC